MDSRAAGLVSTSEQEYLADIQSGGVWYPPPYRIPFNASSSGLAASILASAGVARLYGFTVYSSRISAQYILVFDLQAVPANGALPAMPALKIAADANLSVYFGSVGRSFDRGIALCNSSTASSLTLGSADCWFDVQYG